MTASDSDIEKRARAGDTAAQIELGRLFESRDENLLARGWFSAAAKAGNSEALRRLAINLLVQKPIAIGDGIAMARQAAAQGDAQAAHLCAVVAANDAELPGRWNVALDYLKISADRGEMLAREELKLLSDEKNTAAATDALRAAIGVEKFLPVPPARILCESPSIQAIDGFLPPAFCDWIVARAGTRLQPASVVMPHTGAGERMEHSRTNSDTGFSIAECDLIFILTRARIAQATGFPIENLEWPMVLHYAVGEQYRPHFDFFDVASPGPARDVALGGQRVATALIYLNDDFDDGETDFPRLNIRYRGNKGDALVFHYVDEAGKPDPRTLHAGLAPTRGEKWLYSQWIRQTR